MDERDARTKSQLALSHWLKAGLCYIMVADAFLSVAAYLSMMPQYVSLPYVAYGNASVAAVVVQLVGFPFLMTVVGGKAQILLMLAVDIMANMDENYILDHTAHAIMLALRLSEESRSKVQSVLKICFGIGLVLGIVYGIVLEVQGINFGLISGFLLNCLLFTTCYAYLHYLAMIVAMCRAPAEYQVLSDGGLPDVLHKAEKTPRQVDHMRKGTEYLVGVCLCQIVISLLVYFQLLPGSFLMVSTAFGILFYALAFTHFFNPVMSRRCFFFPCTTCFWLVAGTAVVLALVLSVLALLPNGLEKTLDEPIFLPGGPFNVSHKNPGQVLGFGAYPACRMEWRRGNRDEGKEFQLLDLLVFAKAIYWTSNDDVMAELGNATYNTELWPVVLEKIEDVHQVARIGVFRLPSTKTRIISIRGSSQVADWLFNADVWAPSALLSVVLYMMPFGTLFPLSFSRQILAPDIRELLGLPPPWQQIRDKIRKTMEKSKQDGYAVLLTGHSLGGGMAQLIGSVEGIQTVTFSPVGQAVTLARVASSEFHMQELPIASTAVSIIPAGDIVPRIDRQSGVVQRIACTSYNPIDCHSPYQTACELYRKCGDPRGRSIHATCTRQVGDDWNQIPWTKFAWYE